MDLYGQTAGSRNASRLVAQRHSVPSPGGAGSDEGHFVQMNQVSWDSDFPILGANSGAIYSNSVRNADAEEALYDSPVAGGKGWRDR